MTATVRDLLREAMHQRHGGNLTRLAKQLGVPPQTVWVWTTDDDAKRRVPGPASCQKIARGLDLDADYVLELAGHRATQTADGSVDLAHSELDARLARLSPVLSRYPRVFWAALLDAFERMAEVGEVLEGGVNASAEGGVNAPGQVITRDNDGPTRGLTATSSPRRSHLTVALAAR